MKIKNNAFKASTRLQNCTHAIFTLTNNLFNIMSVELLYTLNIVYSYFRIVINFMSKENISERRQQAAAKEIVAAKMKEITCSPYRLGLGWEAMGLNGSKEDLDYSLGKLSKCRLALPGEVVESPSLEGFKSRLNKHMS